ncbi:hypothetical protein CUMW_204290 [Citrus unshiu]|uniref:tyrosine--tRNA ligase n=1 Tax=Citrus unshiu TaxID=55188 RepID=A0A2H5Q7W9_CITUN|nr:hypothetical protein CUMW_204290 [Citrus unshiu]
MNPPPLQLLSNCVPEVNVKIKEAYCPPKLVEGNPCLEYIKYIIFPGYNKFVVECSEANGGNNHE